MSPFLSNRSQIAAAIILFASGALLGSGLARLLDGALASAAFFVLLSVGLLWAALAGRPANTGGA